MKQIKVYPCGTIVRTIISGVEGMITCSSIRFKKISYEITYFIGAEQRVIWMQEKEFTTDNSKISIGFK